MLPGESSYTLGGGVGISNEEEKICAENKGSIHRDTVPL